LALYRLACLLPVLLASLCAPAQDAEKAASTQQQNPTPTQLEQVPRVPGIGSLLRGFNAGVTFSGVHDSSIGWYNVLTPAVSYSISKHYSADASVSIYPYRLVENENPKLQSYPGLVAEKGDMGDTFLGLHALFDAHAIRSTSTVSFTLPSGNSANGLGAGKATFDFSDHLERWFKQTGFLLDLGGGDSSGLFNSMVTKEYTSVGPLAHFQAGMAFWIPGRASVQSIAYEQLPFGSQTVYTSAGSPGQPAPPSASTSSFIEDNGLTTALRLPLTDRMMLSGYYNRSLRRHLDTVGLSLTYVLRGVERPKRLSLIDRALREAESGNP
jgi:hypothetical protein